MDSQIIISREDNTDFLSLGYIQTDTSLVSALGGALASFAEEIGLSGDKSSPEYKRNTSINLSRFPNGIIASKIVVVGEQSPVILVAIRGYSGPDKDLDFIVSFAEVLAKEIVTKFEPEYTSIGLVPRVEEGIDQIISAAHFMYKKSSDKVRYFTKAFKPKIVALFEDIWKNQTDFEIWFHSNDSKKLSSMSQSEMLQELAKYIYIRGVKDDALFPLYFASHSNPMNEVKKLIGAFLNKKASVSRNEITGEIGKVFTQLMEASRALSARGSIEISDVDLIDEGTIFEKILVAKIDKLPKVVSEIIQVTNKELYRKLFSKYPLKFVSMSKANVFAKSELDRIVETTLAKILKDVLVDKNWILEKILLIIRQVTSKYSPNDVMENESLIFEKVYEDFINSVMKEHPFILLADPTFASLGPIVRKLSKEALEKFRTSLDEAVILYNVIGQTYSTLTNENNPSTQDLMILYFLQNVIQPYQLRDVPDMVYTLIADCLEKTVQGKRRKPEVILENSMREFEKKLQFNIVPDTKKTVLGRISRAKPTLQRFETFENLGFFSQSFRSSLETTISRILQTIFGPEKLPYPPNELLRMIEKLSSELQSFFILKEFIDRITRRPGGRELFSSDGIKILDKNTKIKSILPTAIELAQEAYNSGWLKPIDQKKLTNISEVQLKSLKVKIPSLELEGRVDTILEYPKVVEHLWVKFAVKIIERRQKDLKNAISIFDKQSKISAGDTSGKKKFGITLKKLKTLHKSLTSLVAGGGIMRKFFTGSKELNLLSHEVVNELSPTLKFHPIEFEKELIHLLATKIKDSFRSVVGDFQDLMKIYTSIWFVDSQYIEDLESKFFWEGVGKKDISSNDNNSLEGKINENLKAAYKKKRINGAQKSIIRRTIVEEAIPIFYQSVRTALSIPFSVFTTGNIVNFDSQRKQWYISLGKIKLPAMHLKLLLGTIDSLYYVKEVDDTTDVRVSLQYFDTPKRSKDSQSIELFLRRALVNNLNKKEFKALEFFGDLNERYIGKSATNTFYSSFRSLAQIIITPIE